MDIAIILAAGEGTRMKSQLPKVLHKVSGKPILEYVVKASVDANVEKNIVIIGHGGQKVKEYFKDSPLIFREQPIGPDAPYGTGYAVMQGIDSIDDDSNVLILCGDTPLITSQTVGRFLAYHKDGEFDGTVLTALLDDSSGYGRIKRDRDGKILEIIEDKDASEEERKIKEINSGIFCFRGGLLKSALKKLDSNNSQGELYITDIIGILKKEGYRVGGYKIEDPVEIHGINSRIQLAFSEDIMRSRINEYHMSMGVTIVNPGSTYIEEGVSIGQDTIIYPGVTIEGNTEIGKDCIIRSNTRISNSKIGNQIEIESSLIENSIVEEGANIGPNAHLRPDSHIGKNVRIGNFVEVKNAYLGDNSKAGHLTYIGDAEVGKNVNIGCGVIFVNYNGKEKFRTTIGDDSFIGSNVNLVAPLKIENKAFVAAGSTITKDVPEGSLGISRVDQVNKEGWMEKRLKNKR